MDPRTQERVEQWDSRPFSGGYDGLSDLAAGDFSGTVVAAGTWLFMLNGRVVGVFEGAIEDFENASGTVYEAPHPSIPLLCTMKERGGETRAKYYTNETPLSEVDGTLQDGSFTGYVELSENVLSGDYYAVYYGGRRMAAAFIGNAERLITDEEAFERADDEVGIYEVVDVEIDVTDVPGVDGGGAGTDSGVRSSAGATSTDPTSTDPTSTDPTESEPESKTEPTADPTESTLESLEIPGSSSDDGTTSSPIEDVTIDDDAVDSPGIGATDDESVTSGITDVGLGGITGEQDDSSDADLGEESSPAEPEPADDDEDSVGESVQFDESDAEDASPDLAEVEEAARQLDENDISWTVDDSDAAESTGSTTGTSADESTTTEERFEEEAQWRETRRIPSIDPGNSEKDDSTRGGSDAGRDGATGQSRASGTSSSGTDVASSSGTGRTRRDDASGTGREDATSAAGSSQDDARVGELTERIETLEEQRDALASKAEDLQAERDQLRSKNEELSASVERLQSRIEDLEAELERARAGSGGASATTTASTRLSPDQALSRTNLFVRYASKSRPTLETAHGGEADRSEVASNLQLEHHTEFDADDVAVDGEPFEEFLTGTIEYRFVDWLTEMVLYEIRDTGNADAMGDLYDAIPRIDRAELDASISLEDDDTEDVPDQVTFDVVAFDKMGNPLLVAELNDSREPVTQGLLEAMEEAASAVKANYPDLAAAVAVTSSYFEPGALEVAEQATSAGFLTRGSKRSYVNLSRKQGYHLCLVESRSEGFHMNVPEL